MIRAHRQSGFSMVELMVALVLGLVIIAGVISVMLANKRSYGTNEGLSQIQESARTAHELLARDIRQSGSTGCDNGQRIANALATGTQWWKTWYAVRAYDGSETDPAVAIGTAANTRVDGTDTLHLHGMEGGGFPLEIHSVATRQMLINNATATSLSSNDQLIVCDFDHATIFRAGTYDGATTTINYGLTGNCTAGLGFPTNCDGGAGNPHTFQRNAVVGRLSAVTWFIGNNGRAADGGRSLFRSRLTAGGVVLTEEVVAGVTDMQLRFGTNDSDDIVEPDSLTTIDDWAAVNSVFIELTFNSANTAVSSDRSENSGRLERTFTYLIALRNRVP